MDESIFSSCLKQYQLVSLKMSNADLNVIAIHFGIRIFLPLTFELLSELLLFILIQMFPQIVIKLFTSTMT